MSKIQWSETEEKIAKQACQTAYKRETSTLIANVRDRASSIAELEDLWDLHDLLSTYRYEIDGKYNYDSSTAVFDFAKLIKEGWLSLDDLKGLKPELRFFNICFGTNVKVIRFGLFVILDQLIIKKFKLLLMILGSLLS